MIKAGIIGAGGYAGQTLLSILLRHPEVEVIWLMSEEAHKGKEASDLYPHLAGETNLSCQTLDDLDKVLKDVDLVFLALPHGIALNYVPKIIEAGKRVIDLGADYRFSDNAVFEKWYHLRHPTEKYLKEAVFGLPELYREQIKKARLVANPGCYPTASILGVVPLLKNNLIELDSLVIDAKSGVSGAGRGVSLKTHFCERNEGMEAYSVTTHRHMGEIEFQLSKAVGKEVKVTFVPHLVPMNRGILATCYAKMTNLSQTVPVGTGRDDKLQMTNESITKIYKEFYKNEPFVRVHEDNLPNTKYVAGTNYCDLAVRVNEVTRRVIILSAIDNLVKGAAGQAVQNMNLMYGLDETVGLKQIALYP